MLDGRAIIKAQYPPTPQTWASSYYTTGILASKKLIINLMTGYHKQSKMLHCYLQVFEYLKLIHQTSLPFRKEIYFSLP